MELRVSLLFQRAGALRLAGLHVPPLSSTRLFQCHSPNSKAATPLPSGLLILWRRRKPGWFRSPVGFSDLFLFSLQVFVCLFLHVRSLFFMPEIRKCPSVKSRCWALLVNFALIFLRPFNLKAHFSLAPEISYVFTASIPFALASWRVHEVPLIFPLSLSLPPTTSLPCLFQVLDPHF